MPSFLETLFGRKKPASATVRAELAKVEAALEAAPGRIERAQSALKRVAGLTDAEHEAAIAELGAAERASVRFQAQAADLHVALDEALKAEAATARRARAEAARKRTAGMEKLLDRFDEQAAALAATAQEIEAIDSEVSAVNRENDAARGAGLEAPEPIKTSQELFRTEPDIVVPERQVIDEHWYVGERRVGSMVTVEHQGRQVPTVAGATLRKVPRIIPGESLPGRRMDTPLFHLCLPATRIGRAGHWPRKT